jgi:lipoprotein-anchoring transpeptidase ErfK/SrfK
MHFPALIPSLSTERSLRRPAVLLAASALALLALAPLAGGNTGEGAGKRPAAHLAPAKKAAPAYPRRFGLTNERIARWAPVLRPAVVRTAPRASARPVTTLETGTSDGTTNIVLVLGGLDRSSSETWYRVRLPILPNNSTGWVQRSALGALYTVHTHLYVSLRTLTATLKRDGRTVFTTRVGVGRSAYPTPRGQFYVRDKLTGFDDPVYGPIAFGTSARSAVLTDWPGGGFVGVHGTNEPQLLPGRVSHGCIRMPNESILKLSRMMAVGTPLTIT